MKPYEYLVNIEVVRKTGKCGDRHAILTAIPTFVLPECLRILTLNEAADTVESMYHFPYLKVRGTVTSVNGVVLDITSRRIV